MHKEAHSFRRNPELEHPVTERHHIEMSRRSSQGSLKENTHRGDSELELGPLEGGHQGKQRTIHHVMSDRSTKLDPNLLLKRKARSKGEARELQTEEERGANLSRRGGAGETSLRMGGELKDGWRRHHPSAMPRAGTRRC